MQYPGQLFFSLSSSSSEELVVVFGTSSYRYINGIWNQYCDVPLSFYCFRLPEGDTTWIAGIRVATATIFILQLLCDTVAVIVSIMSLMLSIISVLYSYCYWYSWSWPSFFPWWSSPATLASFYTPVIWPMRPNERLKGERERERESALISINIIFSDKSRLVPHSGHNVFSFFKLP